MIAQSPKTGVSKRCGNPKCKQYKDTSEFSKRSDAKDGLCEWCRNCTRARNKALYYRKKREDPVALSAHFRKSHLRLKYGMTQWDYDFLLAIQGFQCAICDVKHSETSPLVIDHVDLADGSPFVRGLLCNGCNTGIGLLRELARNCTKAAQYIEDAEERIRERFALN